MTSPTIQLTPQYLKELRIKHRNTLDTELVEVVNQKILKANLSGKTSVEIGIRTDFSWRKLNEHFESLGFFVGSAGYAGDHYDEDGFQVYHFIFSWYINEHDE